MRLPKRKHIRLREYDYSAAGCYFVTVCTHQMRRWFSVGAAPCGRPSPTDELAERWLKKLPEKYPHIALDKYVIMPNHIHAIIRILPPEETGGHMGPPLPQILDWYKTMTTNEWIRRAKAGELPPFQKKIWQRTYYEHVIRNEESYRRIWSYIDNNPAKWAEDEYYVPEETGENSRGQPRDCRKAGGHMGPPLPRS